MDAPDKSDSRVHRDDHDKHPLLKAYDNGSDVTNLETVFSKRDGEPIFTNVPAKPLRISRRQYGLVVAFRDITERKAMQ
ncbi:MAG: PAS domain-containing protein [Myxococcota bacterium]